MPHFTKTSQQLSKISLQSPSYFKNIDVAANFKAYYEQFESVVRTSKSTFSASDLANLPKGYSLDITSASASNTAISRVSNVYKNADEINKINDLNETLPSGARQIYVYETNFSLASMKTSNSASEFDFNPDMSVYERDDGTFSRESVFISFLKSQNATAKSVGDTQYFNPNFDSSNGRGGVDFSGVFGNLAEIKNILENLLKNSIVWTGENIDELAQSVFEKAKILEQTKV